MVMYMKERKRVACSKETHVSRIVVSALFAVLAATFVSLTSMVPVFAYEDEYAKNGDITWRWAEDYREGIYTLDDRMNSTTSDLVLFFVTENAHYINNWSIRYEFAGKMNREDEPNYGFEINVGIPANYTTSSTVELGGITANIKQVQAGIYPGYYNFYNFGYNCVSRSSSTPWYVITLGPNYKMFEDDEYRVNGYQKIPEDSFIEVQKGEVKRLYVLVGELDFVLAAEEDFENWAIETEAQYVEESMVNGDHEEIEVDVPEENLENLLESAKPDVEVEVEVKEPESTVFEEAKEPAVEDDSLLQSKEFKAVAYVIVLVLGMLVGAYVFFLRRKI